MNQKYNSALRGISTIVLSFFLWTFGGVFEVAYAIKDRDASSVKSDERKQNQSPTPNTQAPREKRSVTPGDSFSPANQIERGARQEEKFQKSIEEIEKTLADTSTDSETRKQRIKSKKAEIDSHDIEIRKQLSETEAKIKDLPEIVKKHHRDFVKKYEDNLQTLRTNLDDIDKARTDQEKDLAQKKTRDFLEKVKPPRKHKTLDPNKLPHRTEEPVFKEPRTKPEEFTEGKELRAKSKEQKPILIAANGTLDGILSANTQYKTKTTDLLPDNSYQLALANPPTNADLAENGIEIVFTPGIRAKAAELGYKPVKIYEWVRNNIEYVPTYGSIQGADMCLQTKQCNAFDTASLLIAMLRVSGIHARYVYGTIELPIEKVKNWAGGFTDDKAALSFMATGGMPIGGITEGGKIVKVRLEHMWVEALIDMMPSMGAVHNQGDTWISIDASFKEHDFRQGIDLSADVPFDSAALDNALITSATINAAEGWVTGINGSLVKAAVEDYRGRVETYMSHNYQTSTIIDIVGSSKIIKHEFPIFMGTLPYETVVTGLQYHEIPDKLRHKLRFMVENSNSYNDTPSLDITYSLPQIAGKKITVSFAPATAADEAVIASYLPKPHTDSTPISINELPLSLPAYLINLKPELKVDGQIVATGSSVTMGSVDKFSMTFIDPVRRSDIILNDMVAGEYWGIAVGVSRMSIEAMKGAQDRLSRTRAKLEASDFAGLTNEDIFGEMLFYTAMLYNARVAGHDTVLARSLGVRAVRLPSESVFRTALKVSTIFGIPVRATAGGLMMDVDRNLSVVKALDDDNNKKLEFMRYSGINSSVFEHRVPEQLFTRDSSPAEGISAIKALQIANDTGMPIYTVTRTNINAVVPQLQLDVAVIDDIRNAVNGGKEVTVSKSNVSLREWTGCGYIIFDPVTGNGDYMISGGENGAYIMIISMGFATANPVVITVGLGLLAGDLFASLAVDFAQFVGIGATEPKDWCGSKGTEGVPDYPFGIDASHACMLHDYCYSTGFTYFDAMPADKKTCDRILGSTIYSDCMMLGGHTIFECGLVSDIYWGAVTLFGGPAFKKAKGQ